MAFLPSAVISIVYLCVIARVDVCLENRRVVGLQYVASLVTGLKDHNVLIGVTSSSMHKSAFFVCFESVLEISLLRISQGVCE